MNSFINEEFLLQSATASKLYHEYAEDMPIMDYHSHLDPEQIANDHQFHTITELWLNSGPHKWMAMRANGISERYITGDASDWEKFKKWADTMPYLFRNSLYHWSHLELKRVFGIDKLLGPDTAKEIYETCNEMLQQPEFSAQNLIRRFKAHNICTANDMTDSLIFHKKLRREHSDIRMYPTWKPDRLFHAENPAKFNSYLEQLSESSEVVIRTFGSLLEVLRKRHAFFHSQGCRMSDLSLDSFYVEDYTMLEIDEIFQKIILNRALSAEEQRKLKSAILMELCELDYKSGWAQQYHIGAITDVNTTMFRLLGRHVGFDAINDQEVARPMARFFNRMFERGVLCRTVLFNLNPKNFEMFAVMIGCFQDGSYPGKMQLGPAWWYLDNEDGIRRQINALSRQGLLSRFIGMATDSHSILSYSRHEYFRRLLCNILGDDVEQGKIPASEMPRLGQMVKDICYNNAKHYFNLN